MDRIKGRSVTIFLIGALTGFLMAIAVVWWALWFLGKN